MTAPSSTAWTWRHAFAQSSLPATTKHVLHTLGMFMNELGEGCYPSVADICRYSGLDKKTVIKHLATARETGWIAVSQHGYRGQRWKRQEYAARWPERDLVAACTADDDAEGGGAVPPPSDDKVVELVPEGGGPEGLKVVEQLHQDKTSPETTPVTSPSRSAQKREREDRNEVSKEIKAAYWRLIKAWPQLQGQPKDAAFGTFCALTPEERSEAERKFPVWLEVLKSQGLSHVHKPATYFGRKLFLDVPEPKPVGATEGRMVEPPFGPAWMAERLLKLISGPTVQPRLTRVEEMMVQQGRYTVEQLLAPKRVHSGFPAVNLMDEFAEKGKGSIPSSIANELKGLMEAVPVGSVVFEEWKELHEEHGWRWIPDPGRQPVVFFPRGGPQGLEAFKAVVAGEGGEHDGGEREAAQ